MPQAHPTSALRTRTAQRNTRPATATNGSLTQTTTVSPPSSGHLILRGHQDQAAPPPATAPQTRVQWAEDVIDNEGLGRKSSKVCCIYHRPHDPEAESSNGSSSDSSSESENSSGDDLDRARPAVRRSRARGKGQAHRHRHDDGHDCGGEHSEGETDGGGGGDKNGKGKADKKVINAYERMPRYTEAGRKQAGES